ncbi:hypothetical protein BB560_000142 [Smittium megazygosporum]|uniref:tRNA pseudouridine(55) synthase n=1 Tax=Smittium megazygosporum TaxID=133381 RepID=A0A2T9ZL74_9FUNG|nr:hypothetical protein BB560_000142 [Smittium megazygosporum]
MSKFQVHGIFALNKPPGITSARLVDKVKKILKLDEIQKPVEEFSINTNRNKYKRKNAPAWKLGHAGTLDPQAKGVMILGIGQGCKALSSYLKTPKKYEAEVILGYSTNTLDIDGEIDEIVPNTSISEDSIKSKLHSFIGNIKQTPPKFSALKVNGKPLYHYAYKDVPIPDVDKSRFVDIYSLTLDYFKDIKHNRSSAEGILKSLEIGDQAKLVLEHDYHCFGFSTTCGRGTYIRSLGKDICTSLGTTGFISKLSRTQYGPFILGNNVLDLEDLSDTEKVLDVINYSVLLHNKTFESQSS